MLHIRRRYHVVLAVTSSLEASVDKDIIRQFRTFTLNSISAAWIQLATSGGIWTLTSSHAIAQQQQQAGH